MKITVVGHICLDTIHRTLAAADAVQAEPPAELSYGGIFFSVAALANIAPAEATISPVFGVGKNEYPALIERLQRYPNVDTAGIYKFDGPTNAVRLAYHGDERRTECSKHIADPIPFKRIKPFLDADMVLIDMISGYDVTLETLDEIRMTVREDHTPIYFDVHCLALGLDEDCVRFPRTLTAWRRWLFWLHAVQMNEEEAAALPQESFTEEQFAKQITALNTPAFILTRGAKGCTVFIDRHKHITKHDFSGAAIDRQIDSTGCGDVFGAAYCAKFLTTKDILQSVEFANSVAGFKAALVGSKDIDQLTAFRIKKQANSSIASPKVMEVKP
jgi:sugar/nucleoside kinase (ribokinase family)